MMGVDLVLDCALVRETCLPVELRALVKSFLYARLDNETIREAVEMWCDGMGTEKTEVLLRYGDISLWNTSEVTFTRGLFRSRRSF